MPLQKSTIVCFECISEGRLGNISELGGPEAVNYIVRRRFSSLASGFVKRTSQMTYLDILILRT